MSKKRTLDSFFAPQPRAKEARLKSPTLANLPCEETTTIEHRAALVQDSEADTSYLDSPSVHSTYPFPIRPFSVELSEALGFAPAAEASIINNRPDLDLLYYEPYIPKHVHRDLFRFLRRELFYYRVKYTIKRGSVETEINTPRFTTVFGVDETSAFVPQSADPRMTNEQLAALILVDSKTRNAVPKDMYTCKPRPIPACLDRLRELTEAATGCAFNFCLVNYYANGADSISYHSDDERFLGPEPAIASFSLGAKRDFLMKHKPATSAQSKDEFAKPLKLTLAPGDMILMRGKTQANWLHSIPKRRGGESETGRINITFRKALVKGGTENYYRYNVGNGPVYRWDESRGEMMEWK